MVVEALFPLARSLLQAGNRLQRQRLWQPWARTGSPAIEAAQRCEWIYGHVRIAWGGARD